MRALVTGRRRFIGSHLSERLLDHGAEVVAWIASPITTAAAQEANVAALRGRPGYRLVEQAIADADLAALLDGVTRVPPRRPGRRPQNWGRDFQVYTQLNVDATQILLEACVGRPIERVVCVELVGVGDEARLPMIEEQPLRRCRRAGDRLAAEHLCYLYHVNHQVPTVSLRYFTVYGPRQRRHGLQPLPGRPDRRAAAGQRRRAADPRLHLRRRRGVGDAPPPRGVPGARLQYRGRFAGVAARVFDLLGRVTGRAVRIDHQPSQKGDMRDTFADTTAARRDLGFDPGVSLEEGSGRCIAGWKRREHESVQAVSSIAGLAGAAACGGRANRRPGTLSADQFLYERGQAAFKDGKWVDARE